MISVSRSPSRRTKNLVKEIEIRERLSLDLLKREEWDVFMMVFMATDEAQHAFWHLQEPNEGDALARHRNVIRDVYCRADQVIGAMLGQVAADSKGREITATIASDHGAGQLRWIINLNRWLAEAGYLRFLKTSDNLAGRAKSVTVKKMAYAYRRYVPARWRAAFRTRFGGRRFERAKAEVESMQYASAIDWAKTKAYALGAGGNIFINLQGREPMGIVQPGDEYDRLCQDIIHSLRKMVGPDSGQAIIEAIYRREEIYQEAYLEQAPDLIIQWKDYTFWGRGRYDSLAPVFESHNRLEFSDMPLTGTHRPEGILIAQWPSIRRGGKIEGSRLIDLASTILGILSIRPPVEMDGQDRKSSSLPKKPAGLATLLQARASSNPARILNTARKRREKSERLHSLGYL